MNNFIKIEAKDVKEGMRFSAPVFFDDGKNMFLAEGKSVKPYHVAALKRWSIPFLLTYGRELNKNEIPDLSTVSVEKPVEPVEPVEELEELEEI